MRRLLAAAAAVLAGLISTASGFEGEIRLKRIEVVDAYGFDRPVPAFHILVPYDWTTDGGVVWSYNGNGCGFGMPYINWSATGPDGISGVQILPSETWGGMSYAANPDGCPQVMTTHLTEFLPWYLKRYRPSIRNYTYRARPEFAEELNKQASRTGNALGGQTLLYAEAGEASYEWDWNGRTVRERVGLVVVFSVTNNPGGYAAVNVSVLGGLALRAPQGVDPGSYEIFANTFLVVPGYAALIQEFQARMQAIALKGVMDRAAIWRKVQAEIGEIIAQVYADAQAAYDRVSADRSRAMRGVEVATDPTTGQDIEIPAGAGSAWQMPDGTIVISDDPNYDPEAELGGGGKKIERDKRR
ncbi:MAG: hypothetical protein QM698_01135 [Micropepsaceae bacterium]